MSSADLRVAFCIDNMNVGGTELNALRTARRLVARGVDVRVFSLADEGPLLAEYAALGVPVVCHRPGPLYGARAARAGLHLMHFIRRNGIHVVHAHDFYSNIFAAPWARLAGARFIASRRWWEGPERRNQRWANRASYSLAHRVLANSPSVAELVRAERVPARRIVVVPNFLDDAAFVTPPPNWVERELSRLGLRPDGAIVGCVSSLSPVKDHATLLRAVALLRPSLPQLQVVLVGRDGGVRLALEALARELGIASSVCFAGELPQHPSPHYLFDVSVLTSVSEGLPNSVLEAMAAARPVVATAVGAVGDAVADGITGLLVPPGDFAALAARLKRLLDDPTLRQALGTQGRERARERYSEGAALRALLRTYVELTPHEAAGKRDLTVRGGV